MRKIKKIMTLVTSVIMVGSISVGTLAGCNSCEHVYTYTVITPATCLSEGTQKGVCGICGNEIEAKIPVDPNAHAYTDWVITQPTATTTGKAVKTCTLSTAHAAAEVELPVVPSSGNGGYTRVETTVAPTALKEGEKTFVLANEIEDITFTQVVAARGIQNSADAIEAAIAYRSQIRHAEGQQGYDLYTASSVANGAAEKTVSSWANFEYTYGNDNYVYIYDEGAATGTEERWCSYTDDGEYWAYKLVRDSNNERSLLREEEESYMYGNFLSLEFGGGHSAYGVENFLEGFYNYGNDIDPNGDFVDRGKISSKDGIDTYQFRFSYVLAGSVRYCVAVVNFTLTNTYLINSVDVQVTTYSNANVEDTWVLDATSNTASVNRPTGERYINKITVTQTAKAEGDEVITNPYDRNTVYVNSFDITNASGTVITENDVQQIKANNQVSYYLTNFMPTTCNLTFDTVKIYLRTANGDRLLDYNTLSTLGISATFGTSDNKLTINSQQAGDIKIVVKTANVEKVLNFNVTRVTPSSLKACVYEYVNGSYKWNNDTKTASVYVGQTLTFKAQVPSSESAYADNIYQVSVDPASTTDYTVTYSEDGDESYFVAKTAGTYRIKMTVDTLSVNLTVTVTAAPSMDDVLSGDYTATLEYPTRGTTATVSFKSNNEVYVTVSSKTEVLSYSYTTDENGKVTLTTAHKSGVENGFVITLNDAYDLVLSHTTEFGKTEEVILGRA
jgi:hypothetical protein